MNTQNHDVTLPEKPVVSEIVCKKWQKIIDLLARTLHVPAGLIMKVHPSEIEVFVSSRTENNPYKKGEKAKLNTGLYCETVMANRAPLLVENALKDPAWDHNPDIELNMTYYLGFPLQWPDGDVFGTICVLDSQKNDSATAYKELMAEFREMAQLDLHILMNEEELKNNARQLEEFNEILVKRESRIIEMKEELNRICSEVGREVPYPEIW